MLVNISALTAKDRADLAFGVKTGVDYVAISLVQRPDDIHSVRQAVARVRQTAPYPA